MLACHEMFSSETVVLHQIGLGNNTDRTSSDFSGASQDTPWTLENFTDWLLSEANDIQVLAKSYD